VLLWRVVGAWHEPPAIYKPLTCYPAFLHCTCSRATQHQQGVGSCWALLAVPAVLVAAHGVAAIHASVQPCRAYCLAPVMLAGVTLGKGVARTLFVCVEITTGMRCGEQQPTQGTHLVGLPAVGVETATSPSPAGACARLAGGCVACWMSASCLWSSSCRQAGEGGEGFGGRRGVGAALWRHPTRLFGMLNAEAGAGLACSWLCAPCQEGAHIRGFQSPLLTCDHHSMCSAGRWPMQAPLSCALVWR
jgi:hypothetical protein